MYEERLVLPFASDVPVLVLILKLILRAKKSENFLVTKATNETVPDFI